MIKCRHLVCFNVAKILYGNKENSWLMQTWRLWGQFQLINSESNTWRGWLLGGDDLNLGLSALHQIHTDKYLENIDLKGLQIINLLMISPGPRAQGQAWGGRVLRAGPR